MTFKSRLWLLGLLVLVLANAVQGAATTRPTTSPTTQKGQLSFQPAEFQQLVASIALYPDPLLAQVLMASTYPIEIVQADRWATENKNLKGDALASALEQKPWDPSVKSLVNFPEVLSMMNKQLEWTIKLGNAFVADQAGVMNAVQVLRSKAQAEGNLKTTDQQKVTVGPAAATQPVAMLPATQPAMQAATVPPPTQVIQIESTSPDVVYVPTYDPTVVYGYWPYAAYPPYVYYPPSYRAGSNLISFGAGVAVGAAWGYAWGGCNWGHSEVDVDIDRNTTLNRNIDRQKYANRENRVDRQGGSNAFRHDPAHRQGVPYGDSSTARQYGQVDSAAAKARESYRGRAEAGRSELSRTGADPARTASANLGGSSVRQSGTPQRSYTSAAGGAPARTPSNNVRPSSPSPPPRPQANRSNAPSYRGGAFEGANNGGSSARAYSSRGQSSRSASSGYSSARSGGGSSASPSFSSGGSRSSGGAGRAGGGGGGGGGGRMGGGGRR